MHANDVNGGFANLPVRPRLESSAAVPARERPLGGVHDGRVTRQQRLGAERAAALGARELAAARARARSETSERRLVRSRPDDLKGRLGVSDRRPVQLEGVPSLEPLAASHLGAEEDRPRVHPVPERRVR